jgi:hypothetical protein
LLFNYQIEPLNNNNMISKMNWEDDKIGQGPNYDFESIAAEMKKIRHELHLPVPNPAPLGTLVVS